MRTYLKRGDWNAICDVCGFKFKASQMRKRWDGLMTCESDWETRNPLDFIRPPTENVTNPWNRPEPTDVFVSWDLLAENSDNLITEAGDNISTEFG